MPEILPCYLQLPLGFVDLLMVHHQVEWQQRRLKDVPKNNGRKLTCMTMNCQSAKNKIADIAAVIDQHKPNIIFGTESWLNSNIESNEIFPMATKSSEKTVLTTATVEAFSRQ